jgi:hypothetical protein
LPIGRFLKSESLGGNRVILVVRPFGSMSMVNGMVGIVLGVAFFLIGLGKASVSKNAEANAAFVKKYGRFFLIAGPIIALAGVATLLRTLS